MSLDSNVHSDPQKEDARGLDEAFLLLVDRAMLTSKQLDPCRNEEVRRAVEAETRWANLTNLYELEPRRGYRQDR